MTEELKKRQRKFLNNIIARQTSSVAHTEEHLSASSLILMQWQL